MQRIRITIEVDTEADRKKLNKAVMEMLSFLYVDYELMYAATEIAPNQETRLRDILEEKG